MRKFRKLDVKIYSGWQKRTRLQTFSWTMETKGRMKRQFFLFLNSVLRRSSSAIRVLPPLVGKLSRTLLPFSTWGVSKSSLCQSEMTWIRDLQIQLTRIWSRANVLGYRRDRGSRAPFPKATWPREVARRSFLQRPSSSNCRWRSQLSHMLISWKENTTKMHHRPQTLVTTTTPWCKRNQADIRLHRPRPLEQKSWCLAVWNQPLIQAITLKFLFECIWQFQTQMM